MRRRPLARHAYRVDPPLWPVLVPAALIPVALIGLIVLINWAERL